MSTPAQQDQQPSEDLLIDRRGPALWVTINRPERRNAINPNVFNGILRAYAMTEEDRTIRAVVLTAVGDKAFCAGGDLKPDKGIFTFDPAEPTTLPVNAMRAAANLRVPIIGRINGHCMAGGLGILAMCDIAVGVDTARFGLPEVKIGLFPMQILPVLQEIMPRRALVEMCITGESVDAHTAREYGLLSHVVSAAELDAKVAALIASIEYASPVAIRRGKYALKATIAMSLDEALAFSEGQIQAMMQTEDAAEGKLAFNERRKPNWPGR